MDEIIGIWAGIGDVFDSIENYLMYGRFMFSNLIKVYEKTFTFWSKLLLHFGFGLVRSDLNFAGDLGKIVYLYIYIYLETILLDY